MFTKTVLTALAFTMTATLASASVGANALSEAPQMTNMPPLTKSPTPAAWTTAKTAGTTARIAARPKASATTSATANKTPAALAEAVLKARPMAALLGGLFRLCGHA